MTLSKESGLSSVRNVRLPGTSIKLCTFGDSVLLQALSTGVDATPDTNPGAMTARSHGITNQLQAQMGFPFYHENKWIGSNAAGYEIEGYNAGISGHKIADCITDVQRVTRLGADACLLLVGTNDIGNTSLADMKTQYQELIDLIIASDTDIWALPIMPRNAVDGANDWDDAGERLQHFAFNDWLRNLDRITDRFTLFDWTGTLIDATSGDMTTGYTTDGLHFSVKGATVAAAFIKSKLESYYPSFRSLPYFTNVLDLYDATDNPHGNSFAPAVFTGTSGTKDTGITGTVPDNINIDNEDTTNVAALMSVISAPTDFDQFGGNWIRFAITNGGGGSGEKFIRMQKIGAAIAVPSGTTNKWFKAGGFVKIASGGTAGLIMGVYLKLNNVTPNLSNYFQRDEDTAMATGEVVNALETQPLNILTDTETMKLELFIEVDAGVSGTATVDFGQPYIKQMPIDPTF